MPPTAAPITSGLSNCDPPPLTALAGSCVPFAVALPVGMLAGGVDLGAVFDPVICPDVPAQHGSAGAVEQ